ncbi:MAG: hypothetical protein WCP68_03580 [Enhydrobacter sp.]
MTSMLMVATLGCTSLDVAPVDSSNASGVAVGVGYSLPFATYRISITRTYAGCKIENGELQLSFAVSARADQVLLQDPANTYTIDIDSVSNWFKTADLKWENYPNNMLKSIGAKSTDHTGEVIQNVAATAFKIAQIAAIAGVGGDARKGVQPAYSCKDMTGAQAIAKRLQKAVEKASAELTAESAKLDAMVKVLGSLAKDGTAHHHAATFSQAVKVAEKKTASDRAQQEYQDQLKELTATQSLVWPPSGDKLTGTIEAKDVPQSATRALLKFITVSKEAQPPTFDLTANLSLERVTAGNAANAKSLPATEARGIRYRMPSDGVLRISVCDTVGPMVPGTLPQCDSRKPLEIAATAVPQLGRIHIIPITNGVFQSNNMSLNFADNGALLSGEYVEDVSRAVVASATAKNVADTALQGIKDVQAAGPAAQLAKVKANTDLLTALKTQQNARKALDPSPTEASDAEKAIVDSDTALIKARQANFDALLALDAAKAAAGK